MQSTLSAQKCAGLSVTVCQAWEGVQEEMRCIKTGARTSAALLTSRGQSRREWPPQLRERERSLNGAWNQLEAALAEHQREETGPALCQ